jgi:hypothetical protein
LGRPVVAFSLTAWNKEFCARSILIMEDVVSRSRASARERKIQTPSQELEEMKAYVAQIAKSKSDSIDFLKRAGLLDKKGDLAKPYRV